ncbi:MAG: uncharacterized protein QOH61_1935 [Chloroflexota bacterium]|nr:uncharacterized protein [Chloroflexota bacterium]
MSEPAAPWQVRVTGTDAVAAATVASAGSFWGRFRGLMGRGSLPAGEGLYIPGNSIHMFFMRFPIDALFVSGPDASGARQVVACRPNLRPWTGIVMPVRGAAGVVELAAGAIERGGLQAGATVLFEAAGSSAGASSDGVSRGVAA